MLSGADIYSSKNESLRKALEVIDGSLQINGRVRSANELNWFTSYLNVMGFQWSISVGVSGAIHMKRKQIRYRGNKLLARVSHTVADLVRHSPDFNISSDHDDIYSVVKQSIAERYAEYVFDKEAYKRKARHHFMTARIFGTGIFHPYWDPESGDVFTPDEWFTGDHEDDVEDLIESFMSEGLTEKQAVRRAAKFESGEWKWRKGDVKFDSITPFEFYPDPSAESMEDAQWAVRAKIRSIRWLKQRFGKKVDGITEEDISDQSGPGYMYKLRTLVSPNIPSGDTSATAIEDSVLVYEYWSRPGPSEPNGKHYVVAGGKILVDEDNPYADTKWQLPFAITRDNVLPHQFWGFASVNDAISPQKAYNKFISMLLMIGHQHANAKWVVPVGSMKNTNSLNSRSDEVALYTPVGANGRVAEPRRIDPPQVPAWIFKMIDMADSEMEMMLGANELSMGATPPSQTAAAAIEQIQQADSRRSAALYEEAEEALRDLCMMILDISKIEMDGELFKRELVSIVGENREAEVTMYVADDLNYRKITVELGATADRKRAIKKQRVMEALQYKGIDPLNSATDKAMLMDAINSDKPFVREEAQHESRAIAEHRDLDSGVDVDVYEWYDDDIHIKQHFARMNKPDWYKLTDSAKQAWVNHIQKHKHNRLNKLQEKALEQQVLAGMAMPGGQGPVMPDDGSSMSNGGGPIEEVQPQIEGDIF